MTIHHTTSLHLFLHPRNTLQPHMEQRGGSCSLTNPRQWHQNHTIPPVRNALQQSDLLAAQEHPPDGKRCQKPWLWVKAKISTSVLASRCHLTQGSELEGGEREGSLFLHTQPGAPISAAGITENSLCSWDTLGDAGGAGLPKRRRKRRKVGASAWHFSAPGMQGSITLLPACSLQLNSSPEMSRKIMEKLRKSPLT